MLFRSPTATLTDLETDKLFNIIRNIRDKGVGIIYISHRLKELKQISDRITIMRNGCYISTVNTKDVTINQITKMMVGKIIYEKARKTPEKTSQNVILEVKNLSREKYLEM